MTMFLRLAGVHALLVMSLLTAGLLVSIFMACFFTWSIAPFYLLMAAGWFPWQMVMAISVIYAVMYATEKIKKG